MALNPGREKLESERFRRNPLSNASAQRLNDVVTDNIPTDNVSTVFDFVPTIVSCLNMTTLSIS